jgi:hypothetical protein
MAAGTARQRVARRHGDLTGRGAEHGRAVRRRCGQLQTGTVVAAFKARTHGTMPARQREARHVVPGGDGALTSGPGTERTKPTVGSRVTQKS